MLRTAAWYALPKLLKHPCIHKDNLDEIVTAWQQAVLDKESKLYATPRGARCRNYSKNQCIDKTHLAKIVTVWQRAMLLIRTEYVCTAAWYALPAAT